MRPTEVPHPVPAPHPIHQTKARPPAAHHPTPLTEKRPAPAAVRHPKAARPEARRPMVGRAVLRQCRLLPTTAPRPTRSLSERRHPTLPKTARAQLHRQMAGPTVVPHPARLLAEAPVAGRPLGWRHPRRRVAGAWRWSSPRVAAGARGAAGRPGAEGAPTPIRTGCKNARRTRCPLHMMDSSSRSAPPCPAPGASPGPARGDP